MKHLLILGLGLSSLLVAGDATMAGTWKLNVEKSKFTGCVAPASATLAIESQSDGLKTSYEEVEADGSHNGYAYTAGFDGKDQPLTVSGAPSWRADLLGGADSVTLRQAGGNAVSALLKNSKGVVMTMRSAVSKNGKVLTVTGGGADSKGQPVSFTTVWDKQDATVGSRR